MPPIIRIAYASSLCGQLFTSLFRHDVTEARVAVANLAVVGILGPCVLPLSEFRPFRTLLSVVIPTVERVVFSESTHAFPPRRSTPGGFPHFGGPLDAHRPQTPLRQIE
jgi:hypothetical protein